MTNLDQNKIEKANSPKEMLDHVDENDEVVGVINRAIANKDPKFTHREIAVILFDGNKNLVIQKRSKYKTVHPGMWSLLAGHVSAGADPEKVAYVELQEEFGLSGVHLDFLTKKLMKYDHESHFMYFFVGKYSGQKIKFEEAEVEEVRVVSRSELNEMIKSGLHFNENYLPLLNQIWSGEINIPFFKD